MKIKDTLLRTFLPTSVYEKMRIDALQKIYDQSNNEFIKQRAANPNSVPVPHSAKQEVIRHFASKYNIQVFVESGTFLGIMINSMKGQFKKLYSIELSEILYKNAIKKFENDKNVNIVFGDSGSMLPQVIKDINEPILFWLDGHYSGDITAKGILETPIIKELKTVLEHPVKNHVIVVDDARLFNGTRDYPTIKEVQDFLAGYSKDYKFEIKEDILVIHL